ncbi:MAG: ABC transporter permease [Monoglobaceae bacterium]
MSKREGGSRDGMAHVPVKRGYWGALASDIFRDKHLYMMLLPVVVWYLMFLYKPMLGLQIAFRDYSPWLGVSQSPWVGPENIKKFFEGVYFWRVLKNTLIINLYALVFGFPAPILLALLLNEIKRKRFKQIIQTVSYLPHFISVVVVAGMVISLLAPQTGIVNVIIKLFGGEPKYFIMQPEYFRTIYTLMNIWKEVGFSSIIYMSALSSIDQDLYEACAIDGGGRLRQTVHITLPGIMRTVVIMLIMKIGGLLSVGYESILLLYQPSTYETADVISTYVYRLGIEGDQQSLATAVGLFNSVVSFILIMAANYISKKASDISLW